VREATRFYIDGRWVDPARGRTIEVINPADEQPCGRISMGSAEDVDRAVTAARHAFSSYSETSRDVRIKLLERIRDIYRRRIAEVAEAIIDEMGAPYKLAHGPQTQVGIVHLEGGIEVLKHFPFEEDRGDSRIVREPIGVCGLITPWNWPINQIAAKVVPALAAGCAMVLKPSEEAPFSAHLWAEILDQAGVPAGVFNLVHGNGAEAGAALASHPEVDMVSFTGSTRAGVEVARAAAPTVKRVTQELGGKSPCIVLDDDRLADHVARCIRHVMRNSGQSCSAPTRLLVPRGRLNDAEAAARETAQAVVVGDPRSDVQMGPVVNRAQWEKVQHLIEAGIDERARLICGGPGRPEGLGKGFFVRPTVFSDVENSMTIAREEIFGPVASIIAYDSVEEAIEIANNTQYGLAAYVWGDDAGLVRQIAARLRAGQVSINGADDDLAPFGGFRMSGNGREGGDFGLAEFLELKAMMGFSGERTNVAAE
jgi:aldehyde dehydrogenase (NAD+)